MAPRILQFGTGRLLQAHVDLMVDEAIGRGEAIGTIAAVQTTGSAGARRRIEALRQGPYPVRIQGLVDGEPVSREVRVGSVTQAFNADEDWGEIEALAVEPAQVIVSNTADRGYELYAGDGPDAKVPRSFPAKLARLLHARWRHKTLPVTILPCELISGNAGVLRGLVDVVAASWGLEPAFRAWLGEGCVWADTLVDRIVSEGLDPIGAVAEPYALWAIREVPGLTVLCRHPDIVVTADLERYERLKLHILNLGHTWLAERWLKEGRPVEETVVEILKDLGPDLEKLYALEVLPVFVALGMGEEAGSYVQTTLGRFRNPFLRHRIADIAGNHETKKTRRFLPLIRLAEERAPGLAQPRLRGALAGSASPS